MSFLKHRDILFRKLLSISVEKARAPRGKKINHWWIWTQLHLAVKQWHNGAAIAKTKLISKKSAISLWLSKINLAISCNLLITQRSAINHFANLCQSFWEWLQSEENRLPFTRQPVWSPRGWRCCTHKLWATIWLQHQLLVIVLQQQRHSVQSLGSQCFS